MTSGVKRGESMGALPCIRDFFRIWKFPREPKSAVAPAWGGPLYSLSTVAAYKANVHILSSYGFDIVTRADSEEEKESLTIDDEPTLFGMLAEWAENNAKRVFQIPANEVFPQD